MTKIRVRLLGELGVWDGDRPAGDFASGESRALLAYLVSHRRRSFSRDHLERLFWPEAGGRGLAAALQELRSALPEGPPLVAENSLGVGLDPDADYWLDVEAFEDALRRGTERAALDPRHLSLAAQLYRGGFLAGLELPASPGFEAWRAAERKRLEGAAVEVLGRLIESYRRRGEYRLAAHYARRRVAIETSSEEAHRELMLLCALSGQRSRAIAQYEELQDRLRAAGREPQEETRVLAESIVSDAVQEDVARSSESVGPLIPLAGRGGAYETLREGWSRALQGKVHFTLVLGEGGCGKTRLIKSFLDAATSKHRATVLKGCSYEKAPLKAYQPFVEVLRGAVAAEAEALEPAATGILEDVARLVPELRELRPDLPEPPPLSGAEGRRRLFSAVGRFLESLCQEGPLILFLDDLHAAEHDTLDLLEFLASKLEGPIWIVGACRPEGLGRDHPLIRAVRLGEKERRARLLEMVRLDPAAMEEIAASLVGEAQAPELAGFLEERSAGLPIALTEAINYLWDEGILADRGTGGWELTGPLSELAAPADLDELIRLRVRRLYNSTRRLATLAATMGQSFDVELLQEAADEHVMVVEVGLEVMLKRWLIRQFDQHWTSTRRERDIVLWARGARRGSFEFADKRIRGAVYNELNPLRRQAMHTQVAEALERLRGPRECEALAFHYSAAGQWEKALPHLERSIERCLAVLALDTARRYCDLAIEGLSRLAASARSEAQADRWRDERDRIREVREAMAL